jgi:hypothetical protein
MLSRGAIQYRGAMSINYKISNNMSEKSERGNNIGELHLQEVVIKYM